MSAGDETMFAPIVPRPSLARAAWLSLATILAAGPQCGAARAEALAPAPGTESRASPARPPAVLTAQSEAPPVRASDEAYERSLNLTLAARREVQRRLDLLGIKVGAIDGAFVPETRAAIRDWQIRNNFAPSGWLGPSQLATLNSQTQALYQEYLAAHPQPPNPASAATHDAAAPPPAWKKRVESRPAPVKAKSAADYAPRGRPRADGNAVGPVRRA